MDSTSDPDDLLDRISILVRARRSALAALARAEGVTPEDAVDCVQEGLCTLLAAARRGTLPDRADDWFPLLSRMVQHAARNRRRRHFRARPHDDIDDHPIAAEGALSAEEAIARGEEHVRLRLCVEELCEIQKAVVTLRMLEDQPGEDVAQASASPPATSRSSFTARRTPCDRA